jgi:DNA polymerase III subunit epsilon
MNQYSYFAVEESEIVQQSVAADPSDWRLLRRLQIPDRFNDPQGGTIKKAMVIDVETTGLSTENDDIVQLAMLPFEYEAISGRILTVHKAQAFEGLREPAVPISEEASLITGITSDMVGGKSIDGSMVEAVVSKVDLIIAHNAAFDRPMVERHWNCFSEKPWACTLTGVDWLREGYGSGKLDYLGMQFGWFYDGHRAMADCEACLALLAQTLPKSDRQIMAAVREAALQCVYLVRAVDAPFDLRDKLRNRGYRWRPDGKAHGKVWWTLTSGPEDEISWLAEEIYGRAPTVPIHTVSAIDRFSDRLWDFDE